MWNKYKNGNYFVGINDDNGTKVRSTINPYDKEFISDFAESIDFKITNKCEQECEFCHEQSNRNGAHGNMNHWAFIDTMHPYTECAIGGGNVLLFPDLILLLKKINNKNIFCNITLNQNQAFINGKINPLLQEIIGNKLVKGIGVSVFDVNYKNIIDNIHSIPNCVVHLINGVSATPEIINRLSNQDIKILILGYKDFGNGVEYKAYNNNKITSVQNWVNTNIESILQSFSVVSFDNLALKQINLRNVLTKEEWNTFYGGNDGSHTFYIDGVKNQFAKSSTSTERYPLLNNIDEMFTFIKELG